MAHRAEIGGDLSRVARSPRRFPHVEPWLTPGRLVALVVVLVVAYAAMQIVVALRTVLVMLLVALFLSFAMEPAVQWLANHGWKRGAATAAVFVLLLLLLAGGVAAISTVVVEQVTGLVRSVPQSIDELSGFLPAPLRDLATTTPEFGRQLGTFGSDLGDRLREVALGAAGNVVDVGATAVGILFQLLSIGLVTFYLVADGPRARQVLARPLPPDRQREMLAIWELAVAKTGGYIYSRVLLAAICGITTTGFLFLIGVPYPVPLGVWAGTTSAFVPVVGTYLGGFLAVLVAFVDDPVKALWVVVFLAVYQQVENYMLAPRIQSHTMDVHPAVAFVSVLVGGTLLGAVGALLALPATAILQALLSTYVRRHELIAELAEVRVPPETGSRQRREPRPTQEVRA